MEVTITVDEFGNRKWKRGGWEITTWANGSVDVEGPYDRWVEYDKETGNLWIFFEADYDGRVSTSVPIAVVDELIKEENKNER